MRTKTLITSAVLGMAGAAALQAQVYSVNAVGYINVTCKQGFNLIANQLIAADNTVVALLPGVPEGTSVYKFDPATGYTITTVEFGEWTNPSLTLSPGEGFWLRNPDAADLVITFVGEVPQGSLSTGLVSGFNLVSSQVPQAGLVQTDLGLPVEEGTAVYKYSTTAGYSISTIEFDEWAPSEPTIAVGEGIWVKAITAGSWDREFSVN
ncbi:MAG: hypothetical protein H7A45_05010 [Verrucomicrobiales bacterium]|nr:hypothetical protein [Verrucomicrobiales bacterium]MCP5527737.1 hypothetical protein [Verrucomicrobiales bacterium]